MKVAPLVEDCAISLALELAAPIDVDAYLNGLRCVPKSADWVPSVVKVLAKGWKSFQTWCGKHGLAALPASGETVRRYVLHVGKDASKVRRALSVVRIAHRFRGFPFAWDAADMPVSSSEAVTRQMLLCAFSGLSRDVYSVRDRALLSLGWCGALRPDELVNLRWCDVVMGPAGVAINLPGRGGLVERVLCPSARQHQALCPDAALSSWWSVRAAGRHMSSLERIFLRIDDGGELFPDAVNGILTARMSGAGIRGAFEPSALRTGWTVSALQHSAPLALVIQHLRQFPLLRPFSLDAAEWVGHPSEGLY